MSDFLTYKFIDSFEFINAYDEAPIWSSRFGFLLLDNVELRKNMVILDIGSGAGFPLIELAERLGESSKIYGIDTWKNANQRAKQKIKEYKINNIKIFEQSAEVLPLENNTVDLIISNLGINNFNNKEVIFKECFRVLKSKGKLALTTNLYGHWSEFYAVFESTLRQLNKISYIEILKQEQLHRGTIKSVSELYVKNGFKIYKCIEDSFRMNFMDGTAFFNHHFIKCGWLESWFNLFSAEDKDLILKELERNLNLLASKQNGLSFTVPMLYIEGEKQE